MNFFLEAAIILWKKSEDNADIFMEESEKENKEHWSVLKILRSHLEDVYDLSWSNCSQFLVSGSVDNSAILWDIQKGRLIHTLPLYQMLYHNQLNDHVQICTNM